MNPQIVFETDSIVSILHPLLEGKRTGRDIITRSVLMVPHQDAVNFYSTDGISYLRASVPAKVTNFPRGFVFDPAVLHSITKGDDRETTLFLRDGKLFGSFFGGEIFIPTSTLQDKLFKGPTPKTQLDTAQAEKNPYLRVCSSLHKITETTDYPDLCYLFLTPQGAYASNGTVVAKVEGRFIDGTIRRRDSTLLESILERSPTTLRIDTFQDQIVVDTGVYAYMFPRVGRKLPDIFKGRTGTTDSFFTLVPSRVRKIMSALLHSLGSSGSLSLSFGDFLQGAVRTQHGHSAEFLLSAAKEGEPSPGVPAMTLVKRFHTALGVFSEEPAISIGVREDGTILLWSKSRSVAILSRTAGRS